MRAIGKLDVCVLNLSKNAGYLAQRPSGWGGAGSWSDHTQWNTGVVPDNADGNSYIVEIGAEADVIVDGAFSATQLTNEGTIRIDSEFRVTDTINTGSILVEGSDAAFVPLRSLDNSGQVTIDAGELQASCRQPVCHSITCKEPSWCKRG